MTESQGRKFIVPLIVGIVCAVGAALYVVTMFRSARSTKSATSQLGPTSNMKDGGGVKAPPKHAIRMGTFFTAIDYAPLLVARNRGWLQSELGLPPDMIEITTFQTLPSINEAFATNRLDVVFEAEVPAIIGRAAGVDIRIVEVGATLREGVIVRSALKVRTIGDLRGRRVAVLSGTAMHFGLLNHLADAGVNISSVKILNMAPVDASAAFAAGDIDAWSIWPPFPEQEVIAKRGRFLPGSDSDVQSIVAMRRAFATEDAAARGVLRAVSKAKSWLSANEAEGVELIARELKIPDAVVRLAWPKHDWSAALSATVSDDIERKAAFLLKEHMTQKAVKASDIVMPLSQTP